MRIGKSPARDQKINLEKSFNRVLMPVYIPNLIDYFAQSFEIFKISLESLTSTIGPNTRISIYLNGCDQKVVNYVLEQSKIFHFIDQVVISKENVGKINALRSLYYGNLEPFSTITDADVFFKAGWEQAVFDIYDAFPESGMVGLVPISSNYKGYTQNVWGKYFLKGNLKVEKPEDPEAMTKFFESLSKFRWIDLNKTQQTNILTIAQNGKKAVVGCGHFAAVVRREVFYHTPKNSCNFLLGGKSEHQYIDMPLVSSRLLRLCSTKGYAYHLGNTLEDWMFQELKKNSYIEKFTPKLDKNWEAKPVQYYHNLFGKLLIRMLNSRYKKFIFKFVLSNKDFDSSKF
jgi:hypothetical protein